jgi:hypothetical protein
MPHEVFHAAKCRLCSKSIAGPSLILGPHQHSRVGVFMQSLVEHIERDHPKEFAYLEQKHLEFKGLLIVMQYTTTDLGMKYSREWLRWQIHQQTLNSRIPDEKLTPKCAEFSRDIVDEIFGGQAFVTADQQAQLTKRITDLVRAIRDELQEPTEPKPPAGIAVPVVA